jgi:hypothetical protein
MAPSAVSLSRCHVAAGAGEQASLRAQQIGPAAACWLTGGRGGVHPVGLRAGSVGGWGMAGPGCWPVATAVLLYCTAVIVHGRAHLVGSLFA